MTGCDHCEAGQDDECVPGCPAPLGPANVESDQREPVALIALPEFAHPQTIRRLSR